MGIFSERAYLRSAVKCVLNSNQVRVADVAIKAPELVTASSDCLLRECLRIMLTQRIRHLPIVRASAQAVITGTTYVGMLTMGDLLQLLESELAADGAVPLKRRRKPIPRILAAVGPRALAMQSFSEIHDG